MGSRYKFRLTKNMISNIMRLSLILYTWWMLPWLAKKPVHTAIMKGKAYRAMSRWGWLNSTPKVSYDYAPAVPVISLAESRLVEAVGLGHRLYCTPSPTPFGFSFLSFLVFCPFAFTFCGYINKRKQLLFWQITLNSTDRCLS